MPTYKIADAFDNTAGLVVVTYTAYKIYNPRVEQVEPGRRQTLMDGSVSIDGGYQSAWIYDDYITTTRLGWLYNTFGLVTDSNAVTVCTVNRARSWGYWNAIIYRPNPLPPFYGGRYQGKVIFPLSLIEYLGTAT